MPKNRQKPAIPVRQGVVVRHLRRLIIDGKIAPGDRLPTHEEIQNRFRTTHMTVQRAFDQLAADGFIRTVPKIGRFVAARPPHTSRYALVFSNAPVEGSFPQWGRFEDAVMQASRAMSAQDGISFAVYYNVNGHTDSEGYQALMRDVENQRLAGIIFTSTPFELQATPIMERTDPPRVTLRPNIGTPSPGRDLDAKRFMYRALDLLEAEGRQRIAVITQPQFAWGFPDEFIAAMESRGMIHYPFWMQAVDAHQPFWVRHAVHAILSAHPSRLPDALLVTDDHLVEPVAAALDEFGVRVPKQMRVIGHWNFPLQYRGKTPIELLGFDARELLRMWVDTIDAQRRGEPVVDFASVPARFAWELPRDETVQQPAGEPAAKRSI